MLPNIDLNITRPETYEYVRNAPYSIRSVEEELCAYYPDARKVVLTNSGMEAISLMFSLFKYIFADFSVVVNRDTYYETRELLGLLKIKTYSVDLEHCEDAELCNVLKEASLLYLDNTSIFGTRYDMEHLSDLCGKFHTGIAVDTSMLSLHYVKELKLALGADFIVESYSKYVCGHGDCMAGGLVINKKVPMSESELESALKFIGRMGRTVSPMSAYLVSRGLQTLNVRMKQHTDTARFIYRALQEKGIPCLYAGYGGSIIFPKKTRRFAECLNLFQLNPNFGTTYSTSSIVRNADSYSIGDYVRIFCGLEDKEALLNDVEQALLKYEGVKDEQES